MGGMQMAPRAGAAHSRQYHPDRYPALYSRMQPCRNPWQYLKDNFLSHRLFPSYEDILDACQHAWNSMLAEPGRIASLTSMNHLLGHDN